MNDRELAKGIEAVIAAMHSECAMLAARLDSIQESIEEPRGRRERFEPLSRDGLYDRAHVQGRMGLPPAAVKTLCNSGVFKELVPPGCKRPLITGVSVLDWIDSLGHRDPAPRGLSELRLSL